MRENFCQKEKDFHKSLRKTKIYLHFKSGKKFKGYINLEENDPRLKNGILGEAAFTTGMSGYQETSTDPSFLGQHIIFTNSHTGNYPADQRVNQSKKIHATSLISRNFSYNEFFANSDIPLISSIDTRALTKYISSESIDHISLVSLSKTVSDESFDPKKIICNDLQKVSQEKEEVINPGDNPIVLINYGVKNAIVEKLAKLNFPLVTVPFDTKIEKINSYHPRMIFLSNGPGNPQSFQEQISVIQDILKTKTPIRGICLGHQLLCLALGMKTFKLPFGQRGANHPVFDHKDQNLFITSQNHGYAVEPESFIKKAKNEFNDFFVEYTSLFDKSIEGVRSYDSLIRSL